MTTQYIQRWMTHFVAVMALGCSIACYSETARSEDAEVRVGYLPMVSSLTHFVAVEQKYYEREGLKINAGSVASSNLLAQEIVAGHKDVVIELSIVPLLKLLESNSGSAKLFSLSNITTENGFDSVLVLKTSEAKGLCDLAGKNVGVFPGTTAKRTVLYLFERKCAGKTPPKSVELDPPLQLPALIKGSIEALHSYEPTVSVALSRDDVRTLHASVYAAQYSPSPVGVAAISAAFLKRRPDVASRVIRALDSAVQYIRAHPQEARAILVKASRVDEKIAARMNLMPMSLSTELDASGLQGYLKILASMKEIQSELQAGELLLPKR